MKRFFVILTSFVVVMAVSSSAAPLLSSETPFWKAKPKVYKKIVEDRAIIVSVKSVDDNSVPATPRLMRLEGGGAIAVPKAFAYKTSKNFKNLEKMSNHVRKAEWNEKNQTLFLHTEAFNYHARMNLAVTFDEAAGRIGFKIIAGTFTGMEGRIDFAPLEGSKKPGESSEIGLRAGYRYDKFPIPAFFLNFGLEVVMQKIAERMRSFIEQEYKRCHNEGSTGAC